jgi:hypothetical protein
MQRLVSIIGILSEAGLSALCGIMVIAPVGQWREQLSQAAVSVFITQRLPFQTA